MFDKQENITDPVVVLHDDGRAMGEKHPDRYDKVRCNKYILKNNT